METLLSCWNFITRIYLSLGDDHLICPEGEILRRRAFDDRDRTYRHAAPVLLLTHTVRGENPPVLR